jgi:hypothetical protein
MFNSIKKVLVAFLVFVSLFTFLNSSSQNITVSASPCKEYDDACARKVCKNPNAITYAGGKVYCNGYNSIATDTVESIDKTLDDSFIFFNVAGSQKRVGNLKVKEVLKRVGDTYTYACSIVSARQVILGGQKFATGTKFAVMFLRTEGQISLALSGMGSGIGFVLVGLTLSSFCPSVHISSYNSSIDTEVASNNVDDSDTLSNQLAYLDTENTSHSSENNFLVSNFTEDNTLNTDLGNTNYGLFNNNNLFASTFFSNTLSENIQNQETSFSSNLSLLDFSQWFNFDIS